MIIRIIFLLAIPLLSIQYSAIPAPDFIDLSIFYYQINHVMDGNCIVFQKSTNFATMKIKIFPDILVSNENLKIKCKDSKLQKLIITFTKFNKSISIPFNGSCEKNDINAHSLISINKQFDDKSINLSWTIPEPNITHLLLHYWNKNSNQIASQTIPIKNNYVSLTNLSQKTWYQICMATINHKWITSRFECMKILTDSSTTGPVTSISFTANSSEIYLSWSLPENKDDIPQGYYVNLSNIDISFCQYIIINMTKISIPNIDQSCKLQKYKSWQNLQTLKIDNLPAFSQFNIDIIPINRNKSFVRHLPISIQTKEGESESVRNLTVKLRDHRLIEIEFLPPIQSNGIIIKYRIRFIVIITNSCLQKTQTNYETFYTNETKFKRQFNEFKKCRSYSVEVNPVNGWHLNKGVGKSALSSFRYSDIRLMISTNESFISKNSFVVHINSTGSQCGANGFIIEIINAINSSECVLKVILINKCYDFSEINRKVSNISLCTNIEYQTINNQSNGIDVLFIGITQYPIKYHCKTFLITDQLDQIAFRSVENNHLNNCFTECHKNGSHYSGIVSVTENGKICSQWKQSNKYFNYKDTKANICSSISPPQPWCSTISTSRLWNNCGVIPCHKVDFVTGCVRTIEMKTNPYSLNIHWSKPKYSQKVIGYLTILHNTDHNCEQYHIELNNQSQMNKNLNKTLTKFYLSCSNGSISYQIKYQTHFTKLHQNQQYIVYIMPIVDTNMIGEIINISIQTKLARPAFPEIIQIRSILLNTIELTWSKNIDFSQHGPAKYYNLSVTHSDLIKFNKTTYNESVIIKNLKMCSKYCFVLTGVNDAGWSEKSKSRCIYTLAPKPGPIKLEDIQSGYLPSRILKWKSLGKDNCDKIYKIEYTVKHTNRNMIINTTSTSIKLDNLDRNLIYTVKIRIENLQQTINNQTYGEYSQKQFYTGIEDLNLSYFHQSNNRINQILHISWGINDQLKGSIFEFIIVLKNANNTCAYLIDFQCENCQSPWNWTFLEADAKNERTNLLNCTNYYINKFNCEDNMFNYNVNVTYELINHSVDIYGINLLGLHKMNYSKIMSKMHWLYYSSLLALFIIFIIIIWHQKRFWCAEKFDNIFISTAIGVNNEYNREISESKSKCVQLERDIYPKLIKKMKNGIKISEFSKYYLKASENKSADLIKEYNKLSAESKAMEAELQLTVNEGKNSVNNKKNRFVNILPFDQHRVKLNNKQFPDDYVNASYIPFANNENDIEYIASQGPIESSLAQFWQMIWEQNITCIAMLTQTMEGDQFKCLQYWPDKINETKKYGDHNALSVTLLEENDLKGHIERKLFIKHLDDKKQRTIVHLHMHTWFDHSTPSIDILDKFLFRFQEIIFNRNYPYLVHCSAGVGRTGTFICIDRIVKQLVNNYQEIDIYQTILILRQYRNFLIHQQAQYLFIHKYINHFISKYLKLEWLEGPVYVNVD